MVRFKCPKVQWLTLFSLLCFFYSPVLWANAECSDNLLDTVAQRLGNSGKTPLQTGQTVDALRDFIDGGFRFEVFARGDELVFLFFEPYMGLGVFSEVDQSWVRERMVAARPMSQLYVGENHWVDSWDRTQIEALGANTARTDTLIHWGKVTKNSLLVLGVLLGPRSFGSQPGWKEYGIALFGALYAHVIYRVFVGWPLESDRILAVCNQMELENPHTRRVREEIRQALRTNLPRSENGLFLVMVPEKFRDETRGNLEELGFQPLTLPSPNSN